MDVSNTGLNSTVRQHPVDRPAVEATDIKREARDSAVERREAERSEQQHEDRKRQDRADLHRRVDIRV